MSHFLHLTDEEALALKTLCEHEEKLADNDPHRLASWRSVRTAWQKLRNATETKRRHFTLDFSMENAAFDGGFTASAIMKILDTTRGHVATDRFSGPVFDENGNNVGEFLTRWHNPPAAAKPPQTSTPSKRRPR